MPTLLALMLLTQTPKPIDVPDIAFAIAQEDFLDSLHGAKERVRHTRTRPYRLVRMLASPQWEVRDEADAILRTLGPEALPALLSGSKHPDAEVKFRCSGMLNAYWCSHCHNRGACRTRRENYLKWRQDPWFTHYPECPSCDRTFAYDGDVWECHVCGRKVPFHIGTPDEDILR